MLIAFYYGWSDTLLFAISVGLSHECERIHSLYCFSPKTEIRMNGKQQEMLRKKKHTQKSTGSEQKTRQTRVWKIYVCIGFIPKQWDDRGVKFVVNEPHSSDTVSSVMSLVTCNMQYVWMRRVRFECVVAYNWFVLNWTFNRWFRFKSKFMLKHTILLLWIFVISRLRFCAHLHFQSHALLNDAESNYYSEQD